MKTAREKAEDFMKKNIRYYTEVEIVALEKLLKRQDRDTRHACAEAVLKCEPKSVSGNLINIDEAHAIIMNTKAV